MAKNSEFLTKILVGGEVSKTLTKALGTSEKQVSSSMQKISKVGKSIGKATLAVSAAAAAGCVALAKGAIESYAEYEQLVGGVDTLFKENSEKIKQYANDAYKTAGLSANQYMSTVTSFSASMINSLGGDTAKAAQLSNQAITDMSDNANKMGTDMESIMNTYQSLAKGNFGMLDNLKLGFGGTKQEMQRLLQEASKISGIKYDISNFSDITQAIHVIQTEMGITGTTAKEASTTIQGSLSMLKASWQNVLTGMADENADFDGLITNLVDSIGTVFANIIPRISVVVSGIFKLVDGLLPQIPTLIQQVLPQVLSGALALVQGIAKAFPEILKFVVSFVPQFAQTILGALPEIITSLLSALPEIAPLLISGIVDLIGTLAGSLTSILQPIIDILPKFVISVVEALTSNLPVIIQGVIQLALAIFQALPQIMQATYAEIPTIWKLILQGLWQSLPVLLSGLWQLFKASWSAIGSMLGTYLSTAKSMLGGVGKWLLSKAKSLVVLILKPFTSAFLYLYNKCEFFRNFVDKTVTAIKGFFGGLWQKIVSIFSQVGKFFQNAFQIAYDKVVSVFSRVVGFFSEIWNKITGIFTNIGTKVGDVIGNAFKSVVNTILDFAETKINGFINSINLAIDTINTIPGVSITKLALLNIPRLATGGTFDGRHPQLSVVGDAAETMVPHGNTPRNRALLAEAARGVGGGAFGGSVSITFAPVVYGASGADVRQGLNDASADFEARMDEYFRKKGMLSYA